MRSRTFSSSPSLARSSASSSRRCRRASQLIKAPVKKNTTNFGTSLSETRCVNSGSVRPIFQSKDGENGGENAWSEPADPTAQDDCTNEERRLEGRRMHGSPQRESDGPCHEDQERGDRITDQQRRAMPPRSGECHLRWFRQCTYYFICRRFQ